MVAVKLSRKYYNIAPPSNLIAFLLDISKRPNKGREYLDGDSLPGNPNLSARRRPKRKHVWQKNKKSDTLNCTKILNQAEIKPGPPAKWRSQTEIHWPGISGKSFYFRIDISPLELDQVTTLRKGFQAIVKNQRAKCFSRQTE